MREYLRHYTTPDGETHLGVVMGETHKYGIDIYGMYANRQVFTYQEKEGKRIGLDVDIEDITFERFDKWLLHSSRK